MKKLKNIKKKLFALIAVLAIFAFGMSVNVVAQDQAEMATEEVAEVDSVAADSTVVDLAADPIEEAAAAAEEGQSLHSIMKQKFIEGDPGFMSFVLIALILGLALAIERIIYLNLATTNTKKLLASVEDAMASGGVEAAKEVCRNARGPVASIFYQGFDRVDHGIDVVEKTITSIQYLTLQRSKL